MSLYLALSFLPPKRAAAAFLKKFLAGLDKWKSGTVWQQLEESLSGVKPCGIRRELQKPLRPSGQRQAVFQREVREGTDLQEEVMPNDVIQAGAVLWVFGQHASY